jgi:hypothetical protein
LRATFILSGVEASSQQRGRRGDNTCLATNGMLRQRVSENHGTNPERANIILLFLTLSNQFGQIDRLFLAHPEVLTVDV